MDNIKNSSVSTKAAFHAHHSFVPGQRVTKLDDAQRRQFVQDATRRPQDLKSEIENVVSRDIVVEHNPTLQGMGLQVVARDANL